MAKKTKQAVDKILKGQPFHEAPGFDDGGYVSYSDDDLSPVNTSATYMTGDNSGASSPAEIAALTGAGSGLNGVDQGPGTGDAPASYTTSSQGSGTPSGSSSSGSAANSALSSALKALGLGGGNTSNTAVLGALTGLLSAYGTAKNTQAKGTLPALPVLPGSTTPSGYGPAGGYNFANYNGATAATPGVGYAPVAKSAPLPASSYYTYGQGPQQQQFQQVNGGAPITPITQGMAHGGHAVQKYDMGGMVPNPVARPAMPPQGGMAPAPQAPAMGQPPATMTGGMGMPQRPQTPMQPRVPTPPMPAPQQSVMAQRMAAARPGGRAFADGGTTGIVNNMTPNTAQVAGPQMVQSQGITQQGAGLAQRMPGFHRGVGAPSHAPGLAGGGALSSVDPGAGVSRHVTGPGDGTSDSIPARLANGEYVIDAQAVSMLGNGDNSAGAKRLDEFRKNLRQHKGQALAKGKMAPDAKPVHKYMGGK